MPGYESRAMTENPHFGAMETRPVQLIPERLEGLEKSACQLREQMERLRVMLDPIMAPSMPRNENGDKALMNSSRPESPLATQVAGIECQLKSVCGHIRDILDRIQL